MSGYKIVLKGPRQRIVFPVTPERIAIDDVERVMDVDTLDRQAETGAGTGYSTFAWDSFLPGKGRRQSAYVRSDAWEPPLRIADTLRRWCRTNQVVRLIIADLKVNQDVRVARFSQGHEGGYGDVTYSIELHEHVVVAVDVKKRGKGKGKDRGNDSDSDDKKGGDKGGKDKPRSYTVKKGDTLSTISKKFLGTTTRWREIYTLNKKIIGPNPDLIQPGMVLEIPKK